MSHALRDFAGPEALQKQLAVLIDRARAAQSGSQQDQPSPTQPATDLKPLARNVTDPSSSSRLRALLLAPLQNVVVKGCEQHYRDAGYGEGYGALVTDVTRAVKAWSKFSFSVPLEREAAVRGAAGGSSTSSIVLPPGYIWETLVMYTLDQQLLRKKTAQQQQQQQGGTVKFQDPSPPAQRALLLFRDVLHTASMLHPTAAAAAAAAGVSARDSQLHLGSTAAIGSAAPPAAATAAAAAAALSPEPIIVERLRTYTKQECLLFRKQWGPAPLYAPYIINPCDPSFNCTAHSRFGQWGLLADEAGALCAQIDACLSGVLPAAVAAPVPASAAEGSRTLLVAATSPVDGPSGTSGSSSSSKDGGAGGDGGSVTPGSGQDRLGLEADAAVDAWNVLLEASSLGPAVKAFPPL